MPRCSRLFALLAAALAIGAGRAQTVPPVGTASSFDVATWNVEWFGSTQFGPSNETLQRENVADVIRQSGIDVWALQEIASSTAFTQLLAVLGSDWAGMRAPSGFDQRLAYVYDPDVVDVISLEEVTEGMDEDDFAGRLPYQLRANVSPDGGPAFELYLLSVHMKAGSTSSDYDRRVAASQQLKTYVDGLLAGGARVMVLGDLNDELLQSISGTSPSPYDNFLADDDYRFLTEPFDQPGTGDDENTYCGGSTSCASGSVIDHLVVTDNLTSDYVAGSVARYTQLLDVFDAFGGEFVFTTSDHLPVYARFALQPVANEPGAPGRAFALNAPYPNPFTDAATLTYTLDRSSPVRLELFDALGRRVSVIEDEARPAGEYRVRFNGNALIPGLYIVRLTAGDQVATRRLVRGG
jgi:endonuclease/exonuclease/phosphatase family metal-dependent hydrolase